MRRALLLVMAAATLAGPARGQSVRVSVEVRLEANDGPGGARRPIVYLRHLLRDERWAQALDNSLPIIVTHRLELWRSRQGWIDEYASAVEWRVFVTKEPLQEEYAVTVVYGTRPQRPIRFAVRDSAEAYLERPNLVEYGPSRPGRYYYTLTSRITSLSDTDIDQLERFLAGDPDLEVSDRGGGTALGRGIRRLLLRIAGLPSDVIQSRSEQFDVR